MPLYVCRKTIAKYAIIGSLIGLAFGLLIFFALYNLTPLYTIWDVIIAAVVCAFAGLIGGLLGLIQGDLKHGHANGDSGPSY